MVGGSGQHPLSDEEMHHVTDAAEQVKADQLRLMKEAVSHGRSGRVR